jgi:TRAP-type mannitol/chloroaromatic compound transport system permease large subunit
MKYRTSRHSMTSRNPDNVPPMPKEEVNGIPLRKKIVDLVIYGVPPFVLILAVLGSIFTGISTPTEASGVGAFVIFIMMIACGKFS